MKCEREGGDPNDFFPSHELYLHLGLYGASSCYPSYYTQAVVVVVVGGDVAVEDDVAVVDVAVVEEDAVVEPDTFPPPSRGSGYDAEREKERRTTVR